MIIYTGDGHMSVAIMRPDRTPFPSGDLLGGSDAEKVRAAEGYVSYCGRYSYLGASVVHHVDVSFFPNWCGGDQERRVELCGDRLTLEATPQVIQGVEQTARLVWERA